MNVLYKLRLSKSFIQMNKSSQQYIIQNKTIIFDSEYNEIFDTSILEILPNLNTIIFDNFRDGKNFKNKYNQPIDNLPNSIQKIFFGYAFNKLVNNLPNSIISLTFGSQFNQLVDNLPNSIQSLTFGSIFSQSINNLPSSIINLTFGQNFNLLVDNLPDSIINLTFNRNFNLPVNTCKIHKS